MTIETERVKLAKMRTDLLNKVRSGRTTLNHDATHTINLGKPPRLPVEGVEMEKHSGMGIVGIELRSDDNLYIDGCKVELYLSERQKGNRSIIGYKLQLELENTGYILLNSNVLDYIHDHPQLFPERWKKDEDEQTRFIYFRGSTFLRPSDGVKYVRCLYWRRCGLGGLERCYGLLNCSWGYQHPTAVIRLHDAV